MSSVSPIVHPGRPVASRNAVSANRLTVFEGADSTGCSGFEYNGEVPVSGGPGNGEDPPTLTERVLTFLDKRSARN
jgi:hypothetical protein